MNAAADDIIVIWRNRCVPVVFRCAEPKELRVKLPFAPDNRAWIQPEKTKVTWDKRRQCWIVAYNRFEGVVTDCLRRYQKVYVIQQRRELEKCAPACWNAIGFDCECSCGGRHHGSGRDGHWHIVDEAFAFRWGSVSYSCRLIELNQSHQWGAYLSSNHA